MSASDRDVTALPLREDSDAEFLRWVAGWLDRIDPILQAVFSSNRVGSAYTDEERARVVAFLQGEEVQERLRAIASGHTDLLRAS